MKMSSGVVVKADRKFEYVSMWEDPGETTIMVKSDGLGQLFTQDGVEDIGEHTMVYDENTIVDMFAIGTDYDYIDWLIEGLGL